MKKKICLVVMGVIVSFVFSVNVSALTPTINCPKSSEVGKDFECTIKTEEPITIVPDYEGIKITEGSSQASGDSTIKFKGIKAGTFDITINGNTEGTYSTTYKTISVNIIEKTTTTKTTTTTTKSKSDNNYLSTITIDGEELEDFSKNKTKYFYDVENDVKKVSVKAEAEDEKSVVDIDGPKSLEVGENEFTISVKSENNTTKIYKVIITRKDEDESSDTTIKSIKIRGYKFKIDKTSKTYYLKINNETTELDIDVKLKDKKAKYEIEGNENLKDGDAVKIIVTAEDGTKSTYRIIIEKKQKSFMPFILICGIVLFVAVIVTVIIIKKKKKNNNDKEEDKNEKTKEIPVTNNDDKEINDTNEFNDNFIDNDEEDQTRILSYAERQELEKTKIYDENEDLKNALDDEFSDTMLFNFDKKNIEDEEDENDY